MQRIFALLAVLCALIATPAAAEGGGPERFVSGVPLEQVAGIATYGPFRVLDPTHAALVGITDEQSPAEFAALLKAYPQVATLELIECPGTFDDHANLALGRLIRARGIATHVPADGSVRSGAVELFIAGAHRSIDDGARFAVHAWMDEDGLQATDFTLADPENRKYLVYYHDMGMPVQQAEAFYAMTNSVPNGSARWLGAGEMRRWFPDAAPEARPAAPAPQLAYLDLGLALN